MEMSWGSRREESRRKILRLQRTWAWGGDIVQCVGSDRLAQSSHIVSRSRSCRRSAPHTLQRFRYVPEAVRAFAREDGADMSETPRRRTPPLAASASSALSAAAFRAAMRSDSRAAASASGMSGIVSREDILGLRDRRLVGVDGIEETDEAE